MTDDERRYFVERCLRLELKIAVLEGRANESPPPEPPRLAEPKRPILSTVPSSLTWPRRLGRRASVAEIETMRALRRRGLCYNEIGRRTQFSEQTTRHYTKDILIEREVGR